VEDGLDEILENEEAEGQPGVGELRIKVSIEKCLKLFHQFHYNTYKAFTYNINKCDITYVLFTVISKVIYK
jgi:hypothetical protein